MIVQKKILVPVIALGSSIFLYACQGNNVPLHQDESELIDSAEAEVTESIEGGEAQGDEAEDKNQDGIIIGIPEFIENYFEFGTYPEKIRIPNKNNMEYLVINGENKMDIPESNVLSILLSTLYNDIILYESSPEKIKNFFREIQELEFRMQEEYVNTLVQDADCVFEADSILINNQGNYIRMHLRSLDDGLHYFDIYQEGQEVIYASAESGQFLDTVRAMAGLKNIDIGALEKINKLEVFSLDADSWIPLDENERNVFKTIVKENAVKIQNFYGGCPFDHILKATLNDGEQINIYYSSDSCGILVIEDCTYEVGIKSVEGEEFEDRDVLTNMFQLEE